MKAIYGLAAGVAAFAVCGFVLFAQSQDSGRYRMLPSSVTGGTALYLLDGRTGKTWQLVSVEDDPTGSSDFWSPIDKFDTREAALKRLESLQAEGPAETDEKQPIGLPLPQPQPSRAPSL